MARMLKKWAVFITAEMALPVIKTFPVHSVQKETNHL